MLTYFLDILGTEVTKRKIVRFKVILSFKPYKVTILKMAYDRREQYGEKVDIRKKAITAYTREGSVRTWELCPVGYT
jgi:hypothetical protein